MSETLTQPTIQAAYAQELKHELQLTRRLLERVPTDKFDWAPHPKSMPIGKLATHMANLLTFVETSMQGEETDMATVTPPPAIGSTDEVLQRFDVNAASIQQAVAQAADEAWPQTWTMRRGEQTIFKLPRRAVARVLVLNHLIHHRGQLSVYLRLLDVPVPSIYGPSADER